MTRKEWKAWTKQLVIDAFALLGFVSVIAQAYSRAFS